MVAAEIPPAFTGQVVEWLMWSAITARSNGALHCYLPMRDMGVDGMVRHRESGRSIPVQVKGRTHLEENVLRIHVQTEEADVPGSVLLAAVADETTLTLREPLFLIPMTDVKRLGPLVPYGVRQAYSVEIPYPPLGTTHWAPFALSLDQLPLRLLGAEVRSRTMTDFLDEPRLGATGFLGEMELLRALAPSTVLSTFHAMPDSEFVEYIVLRVETGRYCGVQVKCVEVGTDHPQATAHVPVGTLSAGADDVVVIFVRAPDGDGVVVIADDCFVIPAPDVPTVGTAHDGRYDIGVTLPAGGELNRYRMRVGELQRYMETKLADGQQAPVEIGCRP